MKNTLLVLLSLIMIVSCSNPEVVVLENDVVFRDGLYYEPFSSSPADGTYEIYHDNGQLGYKGFYKDGKKDGIIETYYKNGQLWDRKTIKDWKLNGLREVYTKDGTLIEKCFYVKDTKSYCE